MTTQITSREERGQAIAKLSGQVKRIDERTYSVKSQSHSGEYILRKIGDEWLCDCPDNKYRQVICKHIYAVDFSVSLRNEVQINRVIQEVNVSNCQYCGSSDIVKAGTRHNQKRRYPKISLSKIALTISPLNLGFERMRATPQIITSAMQLYFTGES